MKKRDDSIVVIGDVHGCHKTLLALIDKFPKDVPICFVGDLIDRGPGSADIIKLVRDNNYKCVMGNHEQMLIAAFYDPMVHAEGFLMNGGDKTFANYNIDPKEHLKENKALKSDVEWAEDLPYYLEFPEIKNEDGRHLLVTHSSAHAVWKNRETKDTHKQWIFTQSLIWNRLPNIRAIPGIYNIFGHTPQPTEPRIRKCYANIDTGACYPQKRYGVLTGLQFPEMTLYTQENIDMEKYEES